MSFNPLILRRVRHSRMLLAGIQAEFGLDPRLKHSGVTVLGVASPHRNFQRRTRRAYVERYQKNLRKRRKLSDIAVQRLSKSFSHTKEALCSGDFYLS